MSTEKPGTASSTRLTDKAPQRSSQSSVDGAEHRIPALPADVDNLTAGLAYVAAGLTIGPLLPGTKNPGSVLGKDWQYQTGRVPKQIAAWFTGTDHGIFIHCGPSGLVVVDVDRPEDVHPDVWEAMDRARPPMQRTRRDGDPRRGHYVFTMPLGTALSNAVGALGGGADVRAGHGIIVAAPSRHASPDGAYRWVRSGAIQALPAEVAERLAPSSPTSTPAASTTPVVPRLAELPETERAWLGRAETVAVDGNLAELAAMAGWSEGQRGAHGRGWEKRTADTAKRLGALGRADWTVNTLDTLRPRFLVACPVAAKGTKADPATKWD